MKNNAIRIILLAFWCFPISIFAESKSFTINSYDPKKNSISIEDDKSFSKKKELEYHLYTFGWHIGTAQYLYTYNKLSYFKIAESNSDIIPGASVINEVRYPVHTNIINSVKYASIRFWNWHTEALKLNPVYIFAIICLLIIVINFFRYIFIPNSEYKWQKKIVNEITIQNKDSIAFVKSEILDLPERVLLSLADSYAKRQPVNILKNVKGIGPKTIEKLKEQGFDDLSDADQLKQNVYGIGDEIQSRINEYIIEFIDKAYLQIKNKEIDYTDKAIVEYYENYKKQLLSQKSKLESDHYEIIDLSKQLSLLYDRLKNTSFIDRLAIYWENQIDKFKRPFQTFKILLAYTINSAIFFLIPISSWVFPGVSFYTVMLLGVFFAYIMLLFVLIKHNIFSEYMVDLFGRKIDTDNLNEQRLQLEALRISLKFGIRTPVVKVIDDQSYNAFAAGGRFVKSSVAIHEALINDFTWDEIRAILGHEMTHLRNGDSRQHYTTNTVLGIVGIISNLGFFALDILNQVPIINFIALAFAYLNYYVTSIISFLTLILKFTISRSQEYRADRGGASVTSVDNMVNALLRLEESPKTDEYIDSFKLSYINSVSNTLSDGRAFMESIFDTHPSIQKRVTALKNSFSDSSMVKDSIDSKPENLSDYLKNV